MTVEQKVAVLKNNCQLGQTASEMSTIVATLTGERPTRNMLIGFVRRHHEALSPLRLTRLPGNSEDLQAGRKKWQSQREANPVAKKKPTFNKLFNTFYRIEGVRPVGKTLVELSDFECHNIIDRYDNQALYCGTPAKIGSAFCAPCHARIYVPIQIVRNRK